MTQRTLDGGDAPDEAPKVPVIPDACKEGHDWKASADGRLRCRREGCGISIPGGTDWAAMAWYEDSVKPRAEAARKALWREAGR